MVSALTSVGVRGAVVMHTVKQAAVYGIGAAAQEHAEVFAPFLPAVFTALSAVIHSAKKLDKGAEAHDNAVCAIGKILHHMPDSVPDAAGVVTMWLSRQPLLSDKEESLVCTQILCARLEANCAITLGPSGANLGKVRACACVCFVDSAQFVACSDAAACAWCDRGRR